jgi:type II secretory pathway component GspD/PulD (secretin)
MTAAFSGSGVGLLTFPTPWAGPGGAASAGGSQQVAKVYPLKHARAEQVAVFLRSLFIVVNEQDAYVRFYCDEKTNSLIVGASGQHQRQIGWVLALLDRPDKAPAQAVERGGPEQRVKGYPIKHADGEAAAAVLRSLFLVVNHRVGYARFAFDARTRLLIAVASQKHQKQIARELELLDAQTRPAKEGAKEDDVRSQFVVVNHQQAEARFAFDERTHSLIVIAAGNLRAKIRDSIAVFDQPQQR